ncbi:MAG: NAD(P)/FAD-dependent oxidoreductase [Candidatus Hodarchaeales archaeon]|jgi:sulfide:quinone oxidoreductase
MKDAKTVLILGGGVGGLVTANLLRKKIPRDHKIILVDRQPNHIFYPSLLWLLTNNRNPEDISKPLVSLEKKGIEIIQGEITKINPESHEIEVNETIYSGDYLVIALGAEFASETIPGLIEGGYNFYSLDGAEQFREAWNNFKSGKLVVITATPLYKCPAAPYEAAMLLEDDSRRKKFQDNIQIELYSAEPGPMGVTGLENSNAVRQMVEQTGVKYFPEHQIEKVDVSSRQLVFSNGTEVKYDLLAYVPPHRTPQIVGSAGLVDSSGWIPVDRHTLETSFSNVYAIGDVTGIPLKLGKPLPKAGVFAHYQAEVVVHNISVKITGKGTPTRYKGFGSCFVEIGGGKAGFGRGNFYAEPVPQIKMFKPRRFWHWAKILFEKRWLNKWLSKWF